MDVADIAVRLRAVFEVPPRAAITDAIALITVSIREQHRETPSPPITESLVALEVGLLDIYEHSVDHNSVAHLEAFLSVLFTLRPVLPASSVITWFDHLRPALREPYLSAETKRNLLSLVASALDESAHAAESRSREFRRRLLQLYLVDASGTDISVEDIVEEANQPPSEKRMRRTWRENLESILELDLTTSPDESFALMNVLFAEPTARYPIMALVLRVFASKHILPPVISLSRSPFLESVMTSILVDKSATLFEREVIVLVLIMPYMAIYAPSRLRGLLPVLLAALARAICWKEESQGLTGDDENQGRTQAERLAGKHSPAAIFVENEDPGPYSSTVIAESPTPVSELDWVVLDSHPYDVQKSIDTSMLFTFIYGLFPCNTIAFLRRPIFRLQELGFVNSLGVSRTYRIDEGEIRTRSKSLVRSHSFHPDVLFWDAQSELSDPHSWGNPSSPNPKPSIEDVSRLVSTCISLDNSHRGTKDPEEIVRAALERNGLPYHAPPESDANLSIRAFLANPTNGHARVYTGSAHVPGHGRGDSDPESFGSTPRARMRERLRPLPLVGTYGTYDGTTGGSDIPGLLVNQRRTFESSTERTPPTPVQAAQEAPLLFSSTYSTSPLSLTDTPPPPGRSSARGSRQSSLERNITPAAFSAFVQPPPARPSPLANPSPLSLSSVPLPEVSPEVSPEESLSNNGISRALPSAEQIEGEGNMLSSVTADRFPDSSFFSPPAEPFSTPDGPKPPSGTSEPASDPASLVPVSLSDTIADRAGSESSNEQQRHALETLQHENAHLQDVNLMIMWMREETKRHVEKLHRDRIIMNGEEMERQSLHNRLRDYKRRLSAVGEENAALKRESESTLKRTKQWVDSLQDKLRDFRKEKARWINEAVALRGQVKDTQTLMAAREDLLNDTRAAYDKLKTEMDYLKPKVEQLEKTEKNLERLRKNVSLDESEEVQRLRADSKALHDAQEAMEKQRTIIASLEKANEELQRMVSESSSELRRLESKMVAKVSSRNSSNRSPQQRFRPLSHSFSAQFKPTAPPITPDEEHKKLEAQNAELREDVESLTMMVEKLRGDAERSRIRQASRWKSVSLLQSPLATSKSSPSPATLSTLDLSGDAENSGG